MSVLSFKLDRIHPLPSVSGPPSLPAFSDMRTSTLGGRPRRGGPVGESGYCVPYHFVDSASGAVSAAVSVATSITQVRPKRSVSIP